MSPSMQKAKFEVMSFGGGIQTTALAILLCQGKVDADAIVFADTGGESPTTYAHLKTFNGWLKERGREIVTVRAKEQPLYDYVRDRSAVIPVRIGNNEGLGRRQCTRQWKITPILQHARAMARGKPIVMQLGISIDEIHRVKPSPDKGMERRWPLIEMKMTREDCRRVILDAGLKEPPKSACYFCPLLPAAWFRRLAVEQPKLFKRATALEDALNERRLGKGQKPAFLTPLGKPLSLLDTGQMSLMKLQDSQEGAECEGTCFV